jgi:hypothetical protein
VKKREGGIGKKNNTHCLHTFQHALDSLLICKSNFFFFFYFLFFINVHFGNKINILVNLQEEQLSIFRNKPEGALVTLEDLNNMSYGSKVGKSN